ncbi:MAG: GldG family protein [Kiritimatiellales bacterium]|nr:GldG family protein [Kiritimatiellota bacterium]MBL7012032.1 GldG family protein [Kiritimatiellales bacterium]
MKTRRHRLWIGLNTGAALLLAAVIVLMINYLSYRHYYRIDWSRTQRYALSPKTVSLLESLDKPVNITVFFQPGNVLYEDIHNLLREYQVHSDQLNIQWVDPDRDLALTEEMAVKYQVTEPNVVVFECEGRSEYERTDEIAQIDASSGVERMMSFRGEQAFSSAIQGVVQKTSPTVYFLTGHGECDINSFDQRTGFSGIRQLIERDNANVRTLELSVEKQIPADCDVLIVASASQRMSDPEAELIGAWLRRSGRLMVLADAGRVSGLELLLRDWGVRLRNDVVLDPERTMTGREVFVSAYNRHPVTEKLGTTAAIFHLPRSVESGGAQARGADRPQVTPLAFSSDNSWSESQPDQSPAKYDEDTDDLPGPVSLAVAVEKGATDGLLDMQIRPARIIVFGDSGFVSNGGLTGGDTSLFMSSLNWLLNREQLMAIAPKPINDTRLKLTRTDTRILFWSAIWGIPALAALLGITLWMRRRK